VARERLSPEICRSAAGVDGEERRYGRGFQSAGGSKSPELSWKGLTEPAFTKRYWCLEFATDWKVGSTITWDHHGVTIADPEQKVLEADPFRRLA